MENLNLRIPPHNMEAEQSVLGSMMLSKDAITTAVEILNARDFYAEVNSHIFEAIVLIYNRNEEADLVTTSNELRKLNLL
ncbi:MAG: DnaB-like helicase N-terminal domain-containing protein, partial [Peptoniphilus sp.]|nr:DnaB-like helicase N-terminal domain-containing protein [Peptoniphilus sp.]